MHWAGCVRRHTRQALKTSFLHSELPAVQHFFRHWLCMDAKGRVVTAMPGLPYNDTGGHENPVVHSRKYSNRLSHFFCCDRKPFFAPSVSDGRMHGGSGMEWGTCAHKHQQQH